VAGTAETSNRATNTKRSTFLTPNRFGYLRLNAFSWWRTTRISACNAAHDRNSPATTHQINPQRPPVGPTESRRDVCHFW
jgi:hypothetical protein